MSVALVLGEVGPLGGGQGFDAAAFRTMVRADDTQMANLQAFYDLLADWNRKMNLVGPSALDNFWLRHAYDSAQLLNMAPAANVWADLGSGAGFPGLVLAIMLKGRAGAHVHLVESMAKRCRFLMAVARELELPVTVHNARSERLTLNVDVATARACAPLARLLGYAWPYLKQGATGLFFKGQGVDAELAEARKYWVFEAELKSSLSASEGRIVEIRRLSRVRSV